MPQTYAAALEHLHALGLELTPNEDGSRRKWDLAHMRTLAAALGNPQTRFPCILIAGTNGKGSTAATLAGILTAAGYSTALYTSPHLERVNERIRIDGSQIDDDSFARLFFQVESTAAALVEDGTLPHPPSFFETLTALAFLYFAEQPARIAILEVGLGGRLDATNIVEPLLSILTDIALDHQEYLGPTIAAITREKCGILRAGGTLITLPQHPEANQAIGEAAATLNLNAISAATYIPHAPPRGHSMADEAPGAPCLASETWASTAPHPLTPNHYTLTLDNAPLDVVSPLPGHHQQRNIALAIAAAAELRHTHSYTIPNSAIAAGIRATQWPGRLELVHSNSAIAAGIRATQWPGRLELVHSQATQDLLLDVAHNPAGAWTLRAAIAQLPEGRPRTLIFSCLQDKPLPELARILFPLFDASPGGDPARAQDHLILTQIASPRAYPLADLLAQAEALSIPAHGAPHPAAALAQARVVTPTGGLILATGSIYLIGALRALTVSPPDRHPE